jgi:hypothetical protein
MNYVNKSHFNYNILSRVRGSVTNNNGFWIRWLNLLALILQSLLIILTYNNLRSMTVYDLIQSLLDYERLLFYCDWHGSDLRIGHFFSFRCPLVNTPQLSYEWTGWRLQYDSIEWSQSYFTTGGLPPISSSWRQVPWDSRPEIIFQLNLRGNTPYVTFSLTRR